MENWHGFERQDFLFEGREAIVVFPKERDGAGRWLFKMEYFDAFPDYEVLQVSRGWHLAFIRNRTRWCREDDLALKHRFAAYVSKTYGLSPKCVPVGMSCGGMFAVKFAAKYPEQVACLYLDAPVLNLLSCPADLGVGESGLFPEFAAATGMTMSQLICYREHPIDFLPALIEHNVPVALVYGKADVVVPYAENGALLESFYRARGGRLLVLGKDGCGHHPHGPEDPRVLARFVEEAVPETEKLF